MVSFAGKNILITGASSGIGAAIARRFSSEGARLFLAARNLSKLEEVCAQCKAAGALSAESFVVDFSSEESIDAFVSEIEGRGVLFDCLVLNAGISQRAFALDTEISVDRKIMETDYFGPVYLTKKLSYMLRGERKVSIAVTSSISGLFGFPYRSAYCAAKAALFGFYEALELENPNIRVTFLIPGRINTEISRSAVLGDGSSYKEMDPGQANGMDVDKCAKIAVRAISRGRHRKLIGGVELVMVHIKKYCSPLFFLLAGKVSAK